MHNLLREPIINDDKQQDIMKKHTITLDAKKFKEILLHSWNLLPAEKQEELRSFGIYPERLSLQNAAIRRTTGQSTLFFQNYG